MRASKLLSLLVAVFILAGTLGATGVMAEDQNATQPGASPDNSTVGPAPVDTVLPPVNNSTISPPDNTPTPTPIPDNGIAMGPMALVLENHTYYPNDVVRAFVFNATDPAVSIIDPAGSVFAAAVVKLNDSAFTAEYALDRSIILANYTVVATDNATGASVNDTFEVTTRPVLATPVPPITPGNEPVAGQPFYLFLNLSQGDFTPPDKVGIAVTTNAGMPSVAIRDPVNNTAYVELKNVGAGVYGGTYGLDKAVILGNYTVLASVNENGTYNYTTAYFNVTMGKSEEKGLHIQYAAYDPAQKAIVVRANISTASPDATAAVKNAPAMKGMGVEGVKVLASDVLDKNGKDKSVEVIIPVDNSNVDAVTRQFNVTRDITRATTSVAVNANGTNIHLSLNDKVDGCWYRMSANIPAGYRVLKVTRADGSEIRNDYQVDRNTGDVLKSDINWYVDNGTLYFYDDPINGYDITMLPPVASNSLAVNVIYGGQLSALVYPFNQTDSNTVVAGNDHLGRTGDNGYANEIDGDAGSKTAVRMYQNNNVRNNNLMMFGNDGSNYHTYSNNHANYEYTDIGQPAIVGFNTVPDGSVESVVISNYRTPTVTGAPSYVNITQKTIIRNNNLWFATVYYINNAGGSNINSFEFYDGCDFNFNGQYSNDNDYYDAVNDTVYGHYNNGNPNAIQTGGFRSTLWSSEHDVQQYGTMWQHIAADNLQNGTSTTGVDGGCALAWSHGTLTSGETWVVPVIWAVGKDTNSFSNVLNYAAGHSVYDVGIKSIDSPLNGDSLDSQTTPVVAINATAMDLGVTDQATTVYLQVKNSAGAVVYGASTPVALSVPYKESAPVSFNWNLVGVAAGTYNISLYTQLAGDQNASNDLKSITVYVQNFTLYPDQWVHANPGDNVLFPLNLSNMGTVRTFDLNISASTAGWASNLYYNNTSTLIASDYTGDGTWDWVNASYADAGKPAITVPANGKVPLKLQKLVPATADTGILDTVTLYAYPSDQPAANSSATLKADTPLGAVANKTFYLHNLYLNTTPEAASTGSTAIASIFSMWSQVPPFADNFMVSGNVSVPIYYTTTAAMPITVTLFYTNGAGNSVQIGTNTSTVPVSASQTTPSMFNFTLVQAGGSVTIPRGYYLVAKIDNQQTTAFNVWYTNAYRSRVDVKTPTYVHVAAINTYNGITPSSTFNPGDTVYVTGNITDPIGAYDISGAAISITAPNGSYVVNNQTMALNRTDASSPALWKLYNYSLKLDSSLQPGVYGINITAYESNGVINRKNISFTLVSGTPAILIYPNGTKIAAPGSLVSFKHSVTNLNADRNDTADIAYAGPAGWTIGLFKADGITPLADTDGDGIPDTGPLAPLDSTDIVVQASAPSYVTPGAVYDINVTARSSQNTSISSMATETVLISTASVVKTLYLHDNGTQFMNTTANNSVNDHTNIAAGNHATWLQSPAFARDFNILDDPTLTLYAISGDTDVNVNVSIISSNGTSSTILGSVIYQDTIPANTRTALTFNLPLSTYNVTVPRGSQLSLHIDNLNNNLLTVSQSAQYPSRIDMNTLSYVNVNGMALLDAGGNAIGSTMPPSTVRVTANVTDPFGSFDVSDVNVKVLYPNNTIAAGPVAMNVSATDPGALSLWKQFERNISLNGSLDTGAYNVIVTANESNGVKSNMSMPLAIGYPINVSASKSFGPAGGSDYLVTITVTNRDNHTVNGVHAYDFYAGDFTAGGFSQPRAGIAVNNAFMQGTVNAFGPFTLTPNQAITITYTAHGVGDYRLSNMTIVGVDPVV